MQLSNYMSNAFPGLFLGPALFYRWPIGLRFELGVDGLDLPYDDVVMHRARALYETVFRPGDLGFVVSGRTRYVSLTGEGVRSRYRRHRPSLFQLSRRYSLGLHGPSGRTVQVLDDGAIREVTTLRWTEIAARTINYQFILKAKANADFSSRRPATDDRIYFVNRTRNIILHLYDDRGMDLIAATRDELQAIYDEYKSWILDYDETHIAETFE